MHGIVILGRNFQSIFGYLHVDIAYITLTISWTIESESKSSFFYSWWQLIPEMGSQFHP